MYAGLKEGSDNVVMELIVEKLKAAVPVKATFRLHEGRLFCELSDEDYERHLGEVIKRLQSCFDEECDDGIDHQYIWLMSTKSGKSLMVKLWSPRSLPYNSTNI